MLYIFPKFCAACAKVPVLNRTCTPFEAPGMTLGLSEARRLGVTPSFYGYVDNSSEHWTRRVGKHLSKRTIGRKTHLTRLDLCMLQEGDQRLRVAQRWPAAGLSNNPNPQQATKNSRVSLARSKTTWGQVNLMPVLTRSRSKWHGAGAVMTQLAKEHSNVRNFSADHHLVGGLR